MPSAESDKLGRPEPIAIAAIHTMVLGFILHLLLLERTCRIVFAIAIRLLKDYSFIRGKQLGDSLASLSSKPLKSGAPLFKILITVDQLLVVYGYSELYT